MAKVVFRPSGKTIECEVGDNLLEVARRADVFIEAPCNGSKSCGKSKTINRGSQSRSIFSFN